MAITQLVERQIATAELTEDGAAATRIFLVVFDTGTLQELCAVTALTASHGGNTIPIRNESHPADQYVCVRTVSATPEGGDARKQLVTVRYAYKAGDQDPEVFTDDPLTHPVVRRWNSVGYMEVAEVDCDGKPIVNSAYQQFDPPVEEEKDYRTRVYVRNEATFNESQAEEYTNAVNSDTWDGYAPGKVKCKTIVGDEVFSAGSSYVRVTYTIHIKDDAYGWTTRVLDRGTYEDSRAAPSGAPPPSDLLSIKDKEGQPVREPVLLDGAGKKLVSGVPYYLEFELLPAKTFVTLDLL